MPFLVLGAIAVLMLGEAHVSARNERRLRAAGAVEPEGDVYRAMQVAYPACFVAMALERIFGEPPSSVAAVAGAIIFALAKALKYWAIASLGPRWTFRVLVPRDRVLVTSGPYRFLRHPNYVGVLGELVGSAFLFAAPLAGITGTLVFAALIRRRIRVETRALGG